MTIRSGGELDRQIVFQKSSSVANEFNEMVDGWSDFAKVWARRRDVSDQERFSSAKVNATNTSRFVVRDTSETRQVKATDRLVHEGNNWSILGIKESQDGRRRFLEVTAVMDSD